MARGRALEDWLPWVEETDPRRNAVVTRSGGILRVARVVPPDLESAGPHDLVRYNLRLAAAVSRLESSTALNGPPTTPCPKLGS